MRKTRAVWHPPWTEVDTLGPARPTLTSFPVSVLRVSRVWGLGKVEGDGGGTNVCKLRDANSPFSLQARVSRWNVSRQHCKVQAARGMPARLPRAFARVALAAWRRLSRLARGCRGEGRQSGFPSWNEPSLAGPALARPAKSCLPWGTLAESSLSRGCSSKLPQKPQRKPGWGSKRHTRL